MHLLSAIVVIIFGLFLVGLAVLVFVKPMQAERFLNLFASNARAHYIEQLLRLLVGGALVNYQSSMWLPAVFLIFGWVLVITAAGLLCIPWRWHHQFAKWAIPLAVQNLRWYGAGAFALGVFILFSASWRVL